MHSEIEEKYQSSLLRRIFNVSSLKSSFTHWTQFKRGSYSYLLHRRRRPTHGRHESYTYSRWAVRNRTTWMQNMRMKHEMFCFVAIRLHYDFAFGMLKCSASCEKSICAVYGRCFFHTHTHTRKTEWTLNTRSLTYLRANSYHCHNTMAIVFHRIFSYYRGMEIDSIEFRKIERKKSIRGKNVRFSNQRQGFQNRNGLSRQNRYADVSAFDELMLAKRHLHYSIEFCAFYAKIEVSCLCRS